MAKVQDVADFFIQLANEDKEAHDMTNLRLNKLLYFAQGHYLAMYDEPLFEEDFQLWEFGPVVRCIYDEYKSLGSSPITKYEDMDEKRPFTDKEQSLLFDILVNYADYTTSELVNLAHKKGSPWELNFEKGVSSIPLTKEDMKKYFKNIKLRTYSDNLKAVPTVDGHHLPVEWDTKEDDEVWGGEVA